MTIEELIKKYVDKPIVKITVEELIKKYAPSRNDLIKMYARYAICDNCPLRQQCTVKYESMEKCINYLISVLEIEK